MGRLVRVGSSLLLAVLVGAACDEATTTIPTTFTATLSGAQEVPPVSASGTGTATFTRSGDNITFSVVYTGLTGSATASHIHSPALTTASTGVKLNLCGTSGTPGCPNGPAGTIAGTATAANLGGGYTSLDQVINDMRAGQAYVNIHTQANPGGEIRGQIIPKP